VVVTDSLLRRELAHSAYNERRAECAEGVRLLRTRLPSIRSLRDVTAGELRIQFAPGWPRWRWRLSEIASAHPVCNPWIAGWGIHWMPGYPGYWVINVSGFDAVELRLRNGRRYRVGTDDLGGLLAALRQAGVPDPAPARA